MILSLISLFALSGFVYAFDYPKYESKYKEQNTQIVSKIPLDVLGTPVITNDLKKNKDKIVDQATSTTKIDVQKYQDKQNDVVCYVTSTSIACLRLN